MAVITDNILVGHGDLYVAPVGTSLPTFDGTESTLRDPFEADGSGWTPLGATMDGVELAYTPEFGEISVDQMKGVAKMWNQSNEVTVTTTLAESSYFNLLFALGLDGSYHGNVDGTQDILSLGVPQDAVVERSVAVVGPGVPLAERPNPDYVDEATTPDEPEFLGPTPRERIYVARRVLSVEGSTINLSRTDATTLAVTLRLMPSGATEHRNSQYGYIVDRLLDEANPLPTDADLPGPYDVA